jgi:UDP-glucose-4-epimerase GalE
VRVLVTGGAGYIGSHAARALARRGHQVVIYDNLSSGHRFLVDGFEIIIADLRDADRLAEALHGVDGVMHFAAHAYVGESVKNPRKYFDNNVQAGLILLNATIDAGVRQFVFSSTCAVYGTPEKVPITEDLPRRPINPYGVSKLFYENALEAYHQAYGLRFASLRYFNAAGADESGEIGELHDPETHLIPLALRAAARIDPELTIYGNDYPTADGTCVRDYVHVNDLADAHVLALEHLAAGGECRAFNLGTGRSHSVEEVTREIEAVTGRAVPRRFGPRRAGDPAVLVANPVLANEVLGWQITRSLRDIIASAWAWLERYPEGHGPLHPRSPASSQTSSDAPER